MAEPKWLKDLKEEDYLKEDFDALYISIGAHTDKKIGLENDATLLKVQTKMIQSGQIRQLRKLMQLKVMTM